MRLLLRTVGEVREFTHLDLSAMKRTGASKRLSNVYSKLQAWSWLDGEAEVTSMLGTHVYINQCLDSAFNNLNHCKLGGAFRDNFVDFGEDSEASEEEKTLEMGTSYDPPEPEQNENRAPNANNMLKILEQEMMKGFGGGIPAFM